MQFKSSMCSEVLSLFPDKLYSRPYLNHLSACTYENPVITCTLTLAHSKKDRNLINPFFCGGLGMEQSYHSVNIITTANSLCKLAALLVNHEINKEFGSLCSKSRSNCLLFASIVTSPCLRNLFICLFTILHE